MSRPRGYQPGDFLRVCDRTGFTVLASDTKQEWTGLIVREDSYESRHPQDFVRGRRDEQRVPDPRPRSVDTFVGPLTTKILAASQAGSYSIYVETTLRFIGNDYISIALANGDVFMAWIDEVVSSTEFLLLARLPSATVVGGWVIRYPQGRADTSPGYRYPATYHILGF